jgi:hypothetical protein
MLVEGSCLLYVLHSGVQHILCCVVVLVFFVLFQFLWIVHFLLPSNVYVHDI